jgi:hypothetical protein
MGTEESSYNGNELIGSKVAVRERFTAKVPDQQDTNNPWRFTLIVEEVFRVPLEAIGS